MRLLMICAFGCGDAVPVAGPPLAPAHTLVVAAHVDDDLIFMEPQLIAALEAGSLTTVYVTTGDPIKGDRHAQHQFHSTMVAYGLAAGSSNWDCGYIALAGVPAQHCRLADRQISMIGLDLPDGGIPGQRRESVLHLVDGTLPTLPIYGPIGGDATMETTIASLAEILAATQPAEIHALDLAATHGRDHSSHLIASSFLLWAAARVRYAGPWTWHRGYNVAADPVTFSGPDHDAAYHLVATFEACSDGCAPCGTACKTISVAHTNWLQRQYSYTRVRETSGTLATGAGCLTDKLELGACATEFRLDAAGYLRAGDRCVESVGAGTALVPCAAKPSQYWLLDSEGSLWNGAPPPASGDMSYDHVRCLAVDRVATSPTCGEHEQAHWQFQRAR